MRRIVLAQLEGSGRGALASYNPRSYEDLVGFMKTNPMTDGDAWLKLLLTKNEMLGARRFVSVNCEVVSPCFCAHWMFVTVDRHWSMLLSALPLGAAAVRIMEVRATYTEEVRQIGSQITVRQSVMRDAIFLLAAS